MQNLAEQYNLKAQTALNITISQIKLSKKKGELSSPYC